jgi:signal transduction histidine kinase
LPRVLCVDDEPNVLAGLSATLRRRFEVVTADCGAEGLKRLLEEGPFACIISDYQMPGMTGSEFLGQARVLVPDAMRILLTGQAGVDGAMAAVNDGAIFRFLLKPCPPADVIRAIEEAIEKAREGALDRAMSDRKLLTLGGHLVRAERNASRGALTASVAREVVAAAAGLRAEIDALRKEIDAKGVPSAERLEVLARADEELAARGKALEVLTRPIERAARNDPAASDARRAVRETVAAFRAAGIVDPATRIRIDVPDETAAVILDPGELDQIVTNLLANAIDALKKVRQSTPVIQIRVARTRSNIITFLVTDTGCGIAPSRLPLVFEPYYTTKPPESGGGLGLFAVNEIVRRAGGTIDVASEEGVGTTVTVNLPARVFAAARASAEASA